MDKKKLILPLVLVGVLFSFMICGLFVLKYVKDKAKEGFVESDEPASLFVEDLRANFTNVYGYSFSFECSGTDSAYFFKNDVLRAYYDNNSFFVYGNVYGDSAYFYTMLNNPTIDSSKPDSPLRAANYRQEDPFNFFLNESGLYMYGHGYAKALQRIYGDVSYEFSPFFEGSSGWVRLGDGIKAGEIMGLFINYLSAFEKNEGVKAGNSPDGNPALFFPAGSFCGSANTLLDPIFTYDKDLSMSIYSQTQEQDNAMVVKSDIRLEAQSLVINGFLQQELLFHSQDTSFLELADFENDYAPFIKMLEEYKKKEVD